MNTTFEQRMAEMRNERIDALAEHRHHVLGYATSTDVQQRIYMDDDDNLVFGYVVGSTVQHSVIECMTCDIIVLESEGALIMTKGT